MNDLLNAELLLALLDDVPSRVVLLNGDQRYLYANRAALEFLRLPAEQLIGRSVADIRGEHIAERNRPVFERLRSGERIEWEGWAEYAGVGRRYTQEWLVPYFKDGRMQLVMGVASDLTELKQQAAQTQLAEHLKTAIVDNAFAALVTTDAEGRIVEFNPAAETMFGHARQAVVGVPVAEVMIPPRYREAHAAGMARMASGGAPRVMGRRLELQALRADGSTFPIEMVLWRTDAAGSIYYTASILDVSERLRTQEIIERQRDALRQSEKLTAMGSLLAGVAHELNNPLAIVMGRASLLEEKAAGTALEADAQRIHEAAERCGRIVRTFLNMARSRPAERVQVAINDLVRGATELLNYGLRSHGIEVQLELAEGLPTVMAESEQIGQILLNLIVNAQQAMAGAPQPRWLHISSGVEVRRTDREPHVWVRVQDNGPGVPQEMRETIFEPFFTTKSEGMGTGLGLAMSRSMAREHGGELRIEAKHQGSGACFRLSLPVSGAPLPTAPVAPPAPLEEGRARLLVIDDEPDIAALIRTFLEGAGYEVATCESGEVALALLKEARFDGVISDLRMPDLDGAGFFRQLRSDWPTLAQRLLFVTGDTLSPGARSFLDETGSLSLDKPFTRGDLLAQVQRMLDRPAALATPG